MKSSKRVLKVHKGGKAKEPAYRITDQIELAFSKGKPRVYRDTRTGENWSFRMWVSEENKFYTKALGTKYREEALLKAEELYIDIVGTLKDGRKAVTVSIPRLLDEYLAHQKNRVTKGLIKPDRLVTIKSRLNVLRRFFNKKTQVSFIKAEDFLHYSEFRQGEGITNYVIKQERSEINAVMKWAFNQGYITAHQMPRFDELPRESAPRRDALEIEEYRLCHQAIRRIIKNEKETNNEIRLMRWQLFYEWFLISANSGIRFAEMRRLRWMHIRRAYKLSGENSPYNNVIEIFLPTSITKTKKDRLVVATAADYVKRLRKLWIDFNGKSPENDQLLFANPLNIDEEMPKPHFYRLWQEMLKEAGLQDRFPKVSPYSLRHLYATTRLMNKVDIYDLSKNMGCSVVYIQSHYDHVMTSQMADRLTQIIEDKSIREILPIY